ncbi:CLN3 protein [Histomonas meleagridis]|uniref:CLN3 protein n=1 Tax=Histomonas meleagridis TaxID=135588 RepID=UPI003559FDBA|nr:CLN3 protein [Histomonas meleagridis]KAH0802477.1 CLN3 protein [Histomonas meleagridis]
MGEDSSQRVFNVRVIDKIAMFFLGVLNNTPYVIGIASAQRIAASYQLDSYLGIVLWANTISGIFSRFINNFMVSANVSYLISFFINIVIMLSGLLICAFSKVFWFTCIGVFFIGFSSNLGETIILCFITYKRKQILLKPWGSGTGGAGIVGASYSLICSALQISIFWSFIAASPIVVFYGLLFYLIVARSPEENAQSIETHLLASDSPLITTQEEEKVSMCDCQYLKGSWFTIMNCGAVYFLEYVIQGAFADNCLVKEEKKRYQYMYPLLNLMYQIGVTISRSSLILFTFTKIWILTLFQLGMFILWLFHAFYHFMPIAVMIPLMIVVGLFGGCSYVNAFNIIMNNPALTTKQKEMVTSWNSFFTSVFIVLSTLFTFIAERTFLIPPKID